MMAIVSTVQMRIREEKEALSADLLKRETETERERQRETERERHRERETERETERERDRERDRERERERAERGLGKARVSEIFELQCVNDCESSHVVWVYRMLLCVKQPTQWCSLEELKH